MKSNDDNILNRPILKQNSNLSNDYPSVYQNIPLDKNHPNLQLPLKPESRIDSSHSENISTESCHN